MQTAQVKDSGLILDASHKSRCPQASSTNLGVPTISSDFSWKKITKM
jgi:hypothetical protein